MKFPERFIKWIEMCFTSPKFPIAFNGFLVGYFQDRLSTCDRLAKRAGRVICYVFNAEIRVKQGIIYSLNVFSPVGSGRERHGIVLGSMCVSTGIR